MIITKTNRSRTSILFFVKKNRINKDGYVPILLRITVDKCVEEISIKRKVLLKNWNTTKGCSNGKDAYDKILNAYLNEIKLQISDIEYQLIKERLPVSAALIKKKLLNKDGKDKTLTEVYTEHNTKCRQLIGKDYTRSTVQKFETSLKHMKEFLKTVYKRNDIFLHELNNEFIRDFDFFLKTNKKLQNNSANKHHKNLKKIIHMAVSNEWLDKNPFAGFRLKNERY